MSLLSLPLEVFREVLENVVIAVGAREAARLRRVNSEWNSALFDIPVQLVDETSSTKDYLPMRSSCHWREQVHLTLLRTRRNPAVPLDSFLWWAGCEKMARLCHFLLGTWCSDDLFPKLHGTATSQPYLTPYWTDYCQMCPTRNDLPLWKHFASTPPIEQVRLSSRRFARIIRNTLDGIKAFT